MKRAFPISRRSLLTGAASALGLKALQPLVLPALADEKPPSDRGIGGTGITGEPGEGAIGFIGSIQRFGSIFVNGQRIAYPADARVVVDGRLGGPDSLVIGQVVKTVARRAGSALETDHVEVLSEVVGPVEARAGGIMIVLGQRVDCGTTGTDAFAIGERLAVSGIRRLDGTIVARLIQPAAWRMDQVVGPARFEGWTLRVGGLQLLGPDQIYAGRRIVARGRAIATGLKVESIALDRLPDGSGVTALSIEAFAARHGHDLQLGSGLVVSDTATASFAHQAGAPGFVDIRLAAPGDAASAEGFARGQRSGSGFDGGPRGIGGSVDPSAAARPWTGPADGSAQFSGTAPASGSVPSFGLGSGPRWSGGSGG